jgi:hypothetical protein
MKRGWKQIDRHAIFGTSYQGEVTISYQDLCKTFGAPERWEEPGDKIDAQWVLHSPRGYVVSIYNYKDGFNSRRKDGLAVEQIDCWHIGGKKKNVVLEVYQALGMGLQFILEEAL